jgi:hypothetical protein
MTRHELGGAEGPPGDGDLRRCGGGYPLGMVRQGLVPDEQLGHLGGNCPSASTNTRQSSWRLRSRLRETHCPLAPWSAPWITRRTVRPADHHLALLPAFGPTSTQRRDLPHRGLIAEPPLPAGCHHGCRLLGDGYFSRHTPSRAAPTRIAPASNGSPAGAACAAASAAASAHAPASPAAPTPCAAAVRSSSSPPSHAPADRPPPARASSTRPSVRSSRRSAPGCVPSATPHTPCSRHARVQLPTLACGQPKVGATRASAPPRRAAAPPASDANGVRSGSTAAPPPPRYRGSVALQGFTVHLLR